MSDVFISYASADRDRAAVLARALQARGWSIWWDRTIPPGREFDEVIEEALDAARCVVVLWSKASTASSWVKTEAAEAMRRKALIPAMIDDQVKIPLEFRRLQAADLSRWRGDAAMPEFAQFCEAIATELGARPESPSPPEPPHSARAPSPSPAPAFAPAPAPPLHAPPASHADRTAAAVTAPVRSKKPYFIGGGIILVLLVIASIVNEEPVNPSALSGGLPMAGTLPAATPGAGIHQNLVWRDYVLAYSGNVSWDGSSSTASIFVNVVDGVSQQALGSRQLQGTVSPNGPGQIVISTSVAVAGDSRTPGPHSHSVNLIFQAEPNGWAFVRNCMAPNNCY